MIPIVKEEVQKYLNRFRDKELYVHLETTTGAYSAFNNQDNMTVVAFIRNTKVMFDQAKITGDGPFRVGLKIENGWIYAEGLTDWIFNSEEQLLLAGHNSEGKLAIALQLSEKPFK
ncbi:YojF family protein [Metabacillus fastidiosus]|uniref:YojF family protein n=1 Tax=Metabacillus fastidiosus TaxID=1458 RepID=A0ABU6NSQ3_9BACI|nr:YojF family protein [Metabacillus fastidiosus]MEC2078104.1 YojF family protein [Metabacillus fastidiosus]MED4400170.1 YojF family protein [Metabacillus fastidiosus]MED4455087.1 YojF family protein [Metabacillus fastidiosus]MED4462653.1 YojF family protein [Metabacillus fastidiosus]MED4531981.1 YojF family protein [Metabacillus fastidiosus]